jgi:hypothetical protein
MLSPQEIKIVFREKKKIINSKISGLGISDLHLNKVLSEPLGSTKNRSNAHEIIDGWIAHASWGNTYKMRNKIIQNLAGS